MKDSKITYLFGIGDGSTVIDGMGVAMYINHSCDPNCETEEVDGRVWIMSMRSIAPGEELTYDYNLYDGDEDDARCHCGAAACRKTMYSPEEIARRKKAARRKASKNALARGKEQYDQNGAGDADDVFYQRHGQIGQAEVSRDPAAGEIAQIRSRHRADGAQQRPPNRE